MSVYTTDLYLKFYINWHEFDFVSSSLPDSDKPFTSNTVLGSLGIHGSYLEYPNSSPHSDTINIRITFHFGDYTISKYKAIGKGGRIYFHTLFDDSNKLAIFNAILDEEEFVYFGIDCQEELLGIENPEEEIANERIEILPVQIDDYQITMNHLIKENQNLSLSTASITFYYQYGETTFTKVYDNEDFTFYSVERTAGLHETEIELNDNTLYIENTSLLIEYYYVVMRLNPEPAYIYTQQNPLYVPSNGATIDFSSFNIQYKVVNTADNNVVGTLTQSDITITNTVTYQQAVDGSGTVVRTANVSSFSYYNAYFNQSISVSASGNVNVYCTPVVPVSVEVTGTDTAVYYRGRTNTFKLPIGLTFKLVNNDGSKETISNVTYKLSNSTTGTNLVVGDSIQSSQELIYVFYENQYYGSYEINYVTDTISSVSCSQVSPIVKGDYLKKSYFTLSATFASGAIETLTDYEITSPTTIITDETLSSFQISALGQTKTVSISSPSFSSPSISSVEVGEYVQAYNNGLEKINLSSLNVIIHYTGVPFTNTVTLGASASNTNFSVIAKKSDNTNLFASETIDNYNGTNVVSISTLTTGSENCYFVFTVKNYFSSSTDSSTEKTFAVIAMTEIEGLKILDPFTEYRVGDKFLNDNDTTKVVIYWRDENEALNSKIINLRSGYSSISVYPQAGTEFSNVDSSKEIRVKSVLNSNVSSEYTIQVLPKNISPNTRIHDLVAVWSSSVVVDEETYSPTNGVLLLVDVNDTTVDANGIRTITASTYKVYGYIDNILDEYIQAKVVLFDDYLPEIDGTSNMEITFPSYTEGEADLINKCKFGCLFGANNSVNRLFVSGNEDVRNADWHTSELNLTDYEGEIEKENGNFSYIPSVSVMYYGETDNSIVGYEIVSNDKLLVLKTKSDKEKTVYFRVPITVKSIDSSGNVSTDIEGNSLYEEEFGLVKGNNSVAGINPKTIANLNGDLLFVDSDNQVSGLDLTGIVGDNQRYANSRSKYIDLRLRDYDLSDSILWTNNKYLFLSINDVGLFVTRFDAVSNSQYEWWLLTSDNPKSFIEIDNEIYFGNDEGKFVKLFNESYNDIKKIFVGTRDSLFVEFYPALEKLTINQSLYNKIDKTKKYEFNEIDNDDDYEANLYIQIATMKHSPNLCDIELSATGNILKVKNSNIVLLEGKNYYINYIEDEITEQTNRNINCLANSEFDNFVTTYRLHLVKDDDANYDSDLIQYRIFKYVNGVETPVSNLGNLYTASLCERIKKAEIVDLTDSDCSFKLKNDGKYLNIVTFGHQDPRNEHIRANIDEISEVEAYYITAPMFASNLNTFKTIWQITLTNDTFIPSALELAIASNKIPSFDTKTIAKVSKGGLGTNYGEYDYLKVDYDKLVVPRTYTISKTLGMQKFICFAFKNTKGNNAVLSEMAITYTLPFPSYGSD